MFALRRPPPEITFLPKFFLPHFPSPTGTQPANHANHVPTVGAVTNMSSQKQIDSARANGAKSHGPRTEEGRQKSSLNALKHGLYSASVVLPTESREQYDQMLDAYIRQLQPEGPVELDLVEEMAAAKWRQRRLWAVETDLFEEEMNQTKAQLDDDEIEYTPITPLTQAYDNLSQRSALQLLVRHEARLERAYSRALKNLLELQRLRKPDSPSEEQKVQERTQPQSTPRGPLPPAPCFLPPISHHANKKTSNEKQETRDGQEPDEPRN